MKDEDKEYRINCLIENDIKKILKQSSLFDENNLFLHLDYEGSKRGLLLEHILTAADFDISNHYIEWYTDGDNLIIVDLESGYYYEYLMDFDSLEDIVDRSFIEKAKGK